MYTEHTKTMTRHAVLGLMLLGLNACQPSDLNARCADESAESCDPQERDPRLYRVQEPDVPDSSEQTSQRLSEHTREEAPEDDPCVEEIDQEEGEDLNWDEDEGEDLDWDEGEGEELYDDEDEEREDEGDERYDDEGEYEDGDDVDDVADGEMRSITIEQIVEGQLEQREVLLHFPPQFDATRSYPLVFAFHGNGGTAEDLVPMFMHLVEQNQFIGVYPRGIEYSWNLGLEASQADETEFVGLIMNRLSADPHFNTQRAYAFGFSNGSAILHKIAAESAYFKAIAASASGVVQGIRPTAQSGPVSILQMHGVDDGLIPYAGGLSGVGHTFMSLEDSASMWATHQGCSPTPEVSVLASGDVQTVYSQCNEDVRVVNYKALQTGHDMPQNFRGNIADHIWAFFQGQPLPRN